MNKKSEDLGQEVKRLRSALKKARQSVNIEYGVGRDLERDKIIRWLREEGASKASESYGRRGRDVADLLADALERKEHLAGEDPRDAVAPARKKASA